MQSTRTVRGAVAPTAKALLFSTRFYTLFRRVVPSRSLAILRYHAICGAATGYAEPSICISPAAFAQHVAYLTAHYRVLSLPEAVSALRRGSTLPANAVAITFDDGYADNAEAARTLARYGATATFYITAGCLADGQPFWPAELRHLVAALPAPRVTLQADAVHIDLDLTSASGRRAAVRQLTQTFKSHPIPVRETLRDQLRRFARDPELPRVMLTWDEVREMHAMGMTIGSHTMTHPNLPSAGVTAARDEIVESRRRLEREIDAPVTMFSYPNGGAERYITGDIARLVKDAGFEAATTSRNAFAGTHSDPFALERVQVAERLEDLVFALEVERFAFRPAPRPNEK